MKADMKSLLPKAKQPDKKQLKTIYRIGQWYILLSKKGGWIRHEMHDDGMHKFFGHVWLRDGFLFLGSWKVHSNSEFKSVEERDDDLAATPPWPLELARWAVNCGDNLIDCRTGKYADLNDPEAYRARTFAMLSQRIQQDALDRGYARQFRQRSKSKRQASAVKQGRTAAEIQALLAKLNRRGGDEAGARPSRRQRNTTGG